MAEPLTDEGYDRMIRRRVAQKASLRVEKARILLLKPLSFNKVNYRSVTKQTKKQTNKQKNHDIVRNRSC